MIVITFKTIWFEKHWISELCPLSDKFVDLVSSFIMYSSHLFLVNYKFFFIIQIFDILFLLLSILKE